MTSVTAPEWQKQKKRRESIKPEFIDFKRYSRFLNPENSSYDFGLKSLIAKIIFLYCSAVFGSIAIL